MKRHPRFKEYMALVTILVSLSAIPITIWIFIDAYLEKDNYGKFRGIVLTLLFSFHLILYTREYKRLLKGRNSRNSSST